MTPTTVDHDENGRYWVDWEVLGDDGKKKRARRARTRPSCRPGSMAAATAEMGGAP